MQKKQVSNVVPFEEKESNIPESLKDYLYHLPTEGPGKDDLKQLYGWTFDEANQAQKEWREKYGPNVRGRGPLCRWIGAQKLKELYEAYRGGNRSAILEALHECSFNSLPIPRWCEIAFLTYYREVKLYYKAKSWDDVFGRAHPKNMKIGAKKDEREKSLAVYMKVKEILQRDPTVAIDRSLFGKVGKEFGIGDSLAEKFYYKERKRRKLYQCPKCGNRSSLKKDFTEIGCDHCGIVSSESEVIIFYP